MSPDRVDRSTAKTYRWLYGTGFVAVIGFAIVYGTGIFHPSVVADYVVFVLLGALASVLTWGILSSSGEISGTPYGVNVKLAGAIVPLVTIVGGGLWLRVRQDFIAMDVAWVDADSNRVKVTGTSQLEIGTFTRPGRMGPQGVATFDQLLSSFEGRAATLYLDSTDYRLASGADKLTVHGGTQVSAAVVRIDRGVVSGTVSTGDAFLIGARINVQGMTCDPTTVTDKGTFELPCPGIALPAVLTIRKPEAVNADLCPKTFTITKLEGNALQVAPCEIPKDAGPDGSVSPKTCALDGDSMPLRWKPRCPHPNTRSGDDVTQQDLARYPTQLKGCTNVVEYTCP